MKFPPKTIAALSVVATGLAGLTFVRRKRRKKLPNDVFADSRNRLPLPRPELLDDFGKKLYEQTINDPRSLKGLNGPGGIRLYSPRLKEVQRPVNQFLRYESGIDARLTELAILVSARESDSHFEWSAHEPAALKEGLEPEIIDLVRYRRPVKGIGEREAAIIHLGREAFGEHHVSSETFLHVQKLFGNELMIHLVALMGDYTATAALLATVNQQLPEGETSALPEL
jgi:4-carboxymuconolactone decarboxylase